MQLQTPPTLNEEWLTTTLTEHIKKEIRDFFEDIEHHNWLEGMWFEMIEETNPKLYQKFVDLWDKMPCKPSEVWWYEEDLGKPTGFDILINSIATAMELEKKYPDWNNRTFYNPYDINYHEKHTYTKDELAEHYRNYDANQQDILDQINALPITQELQTSLKTTLIESNLWEKTIDSYAVESYNKIMKGFDQELRRNICLDTIGKPRNVRTPIPEYDNDFFIISFP